MDLKQLMEQMSSIRKILDEIASILPADTTLNTYSDKDGVIRISGRTESAFNLIPILEKSSFFKDAAQIGPIF
jgi:tetrahydromethanopterin S-methyltransferase subunit B